MAATLLARAKEVRDDGSIVEIVCELPEPLPPSMHRYKYRLYHGVACVARVRYDNERGKGDQPHVGGRELAYTFSSVEQRLADVQSDVERWESA